jgi:hypothetical protein
LDKDLFEVCAGMLGWVVKAFLGGRGIRIPSTHWNEPQQLPYYKERQGGIKHNL